MCRFRGAGFLILVAVTVVFIGTVGCDASTPSSRAERGPPTPRATRPDTSTLPPFWYGVTLDDVSRLDAIVTSLRQLRQRPIARVVFDSGVDPPNYRVAVDRLHQVAYLMGTPVDSTDFTSYSVAAYVSRFQRYLSAFSRQIDVWEIGNEVNGQWLGPSGSVVQKILGAYRAVRAAGGKSALTLYDNIGCANDPDHDMWTWTARDVPYEIRHGIDYVLVSYYEEDCGNRRPAAADWSAVFARLHAMFPNARVGFGEVGTHRQDSVARKIGYLRRYYTLPRFGRYYLGGYFWWYYQEDMVPNENNPLWKVLNSVIPSK